MVSVGSQRGRARPVGRRLDQATVRRNGRRCFGRPKTSQNHISLFLSFTSFVFGLFVCLSFFVCVLFDKWWVWCVFFGVVLRFFRGGSSRIVFEPLPWVLEGIWCSLSVVSEQISISPVVLNGSCSGRSLLNSGFWVVDAEPSSNFPCHFFWTHSYLMLWCFELLSLGCVVLSRWGFPSVSGGSFVDPDPGKPKQPELIMPHGCDDFCGVTLGRAWNCGNAWNAVQSCDQGLLMITASILRDPSTSLTCCLGICLEARLFPILKGFGGANLDLNTKRLWLLQRHAARFSTFAPKGVSLSLPQVISTGQLQQSPTNECGNVLLLVIAWKHWNQYTGFDDRQGCPWV